MQYSSQRPQPNQFGTYGQNTMSNIGTTQSEQMMMRTGMGGLPQMMQADRPMGQFQYQGGSGQSYGGNWGQPTSNYGTYYGGYQQASQYGWGTNQNIGTTPTEQMMRSGMGTPQAMQTGNMGYYGPNQPQYQVGQQFIGSGYGTIPQYGQAASQYGGYQPSDHYGTSGWGTNQNIGTTPTEQMMRSGMGAPQAMQTGSMGYYGPRQPQYQGGPQFAGSSYGRPQYGQTTGQYGGYQQSNQYGASGWGMGQQNIGTTPTEQMMQSGMGTTSPAMQTNRNTGYQQQQMGTGMSQGGGSGQQSSSDC